MQEVKIVEPGIFDYARPSLDILPVSAQVKTIANGPVDYGDPSQGLKIRLWAAYIDDQGRAFTAPYNEDESWGPWVERFSLIDPVKSISLAFDLNGEPMIAYVREDGRYGVWYTPEGTTNYQLVELGVLPSGFVILVFDLSIDSEEFEAYGDAILAYTDGNQVIIKTARDGFQEQTIVDTSPNYQKVWLANYGWTKQKRFIIKARG